MPGAYSGKIIFSLRPKFIPIIYKSKVFSSGISSLSFKIHSIQQSVFNVFHSEYLNYDVCILVTVRGSSLPWVLVAWLVSIPYRPKWPKTLSRPWKGACYVSVSFPGVLMHLCGTVGQGGHVCWVKRCITRVLRFLHFSAMVIDWVSILGLFLKIN